MAITTEPQVGRSLVRRFFTQEGSDPYDTVEWGLRTAAIIDYNKTEDLDHPVYAFFQEGVEFPISWSDHAVNIVAQKYFRGKMGTPSREWSLKQVFDRVSKAICAWGLEFGYFDPEEAEVFDAELRTILVRQKASFNSPVWFNIGAEGRRQQAAACFIMDVQDTAESIKKWAVTEFDVFRGGSGSGANASLIREDGAPLTRGGTASGPVSFMRWTDSGAGAVKSAGETRRAAKMVILNADHPDIELFVWCKAYEERKARVLEAAGFQMGLNGRDTISLQFQNANNSVRVTDEFMRAVEADGDWSLISRYDGHTTKTMKARDLFRQIAAAAHECADPGLQYDTTINQWNTTPTLEHLDGSNPCSEHIRRRNSSCNLSSLNLMTFLREDGTFDLAAYQATAEVMFTAMDILVSGSEYPTEDIKRVTHADRDLGMGYANLGAMLMVLGLPYDSDQGRAVAAVVTGLLTGTAYRRSTRMADRLGPFPSFAGDRDGAINVMKMHQQAANDLAAELAGSGLSNDWVTLGRANVEVWQEVVDGAERFGLRNAQATVLAPTGTISFMLDCDTTSLEPSIALISYKDLVGGGRLRMINQSVPRALRRLGLSETQVSDIVAYVDANDSIVGAPHLDPKSYNVFATAFGSDGNVIEPMGHVRMMGKTQLFVAGAESKTVNMPSTTTVEDVEHIYMEAWKLGVKCIAVYVDGVKVAQPVSSRRDVNDTLVRLEQEVVGTVLEAELERLQAEIQAVTMQASKPVRRRLPSRRRARTYSFDVRGTEGYITTGEYENGALGEIFLKVTKLGSTLSGVFDSFAIGVSMGLQYGVPLRAYVEKFINSRWEPAGIVQKDDDIKLCTSILDYVFRRLALDYMPEQERKDLGIYTIAERSIQVAEMPATPTIPDGRLVISGDADPCPDCGMPMQRTGTCQTCRACGFNSGC